MPNSPIPGNEPDTTDMSVEPGLAGEAINPTPSDPGLLREEEEAAKLGDFA